MKLEDPLSDGGECEGLVGGDTAVWDMMDVERKDEHGGDHHHQEFQNGNSVGVPCGAR